MKGLLTTAALMACALTAPAHAEETFKIGYIGGFTGWLAFYDGAHLDGVKMAVDEINVAGGVGGKKIELITRDMRSEADQAPVMGEELRAAGIQALIAPCDADPAIALGQMFADKMIPVITSCSTAPSTAEHGGPNTFLSYPADNILGSVLAQVAVENGFKNVMTLSSADNVYTDLVPEYFTEVFEKLGGKRTVDLEFKLGQPDFSAEVTKIKAMDPQPQAIVTAAFEPDFPIFIKALRSAGVTLPVLEVDGIDSPTTYGLGDVADNIIFANGGYPTPGSPLEAFNGRYAKVYGHKSETVYNANGYDIVMIFKMAAEKTGGDLSGQALTDAINSFDQNSILTGTITYAARNRVPLVNVAINRIEKGKRVYVKTVSPDPALIPASR